MNECYEADKFAGALSPVFAPLISTPLYRFQVILQTENEAVNQKLIRQRYGSVKEIFKQTVKEKKLHLWRGISAKYFMGFSHLYFNQRLYTILMPKRKKYDTEGVVLAKAFGTGILVSSLSHFVTLPLEYYFTRVQYSLPYRKPVQSEGTISRLLKTPAESLLSIIPVTIQNEGYVGLYRGYGASLLMSVVYRGLFLSVFNLSLPYMQTNSLINMSMFGFALTAGCGAVVYPIDTVRRRMFVTKLGGGLKYANAREAFKEIVRIEGYPSLYRGFSVYLTSNLFASYLIFVFALAYTTRHSSSN